jgi:hypothetical protein
LWAEENNKKKRKTDRGEGKADWAEREKGRGEE